MFAFHPKFRDSYVPKAAANAAAVFDPLQTLTTNGSMAG